MTKKVNISTENGANIQSVSETIAHRLKTYRKQQKLSLDVLSKRAGVSKGMLVEIEKCIANPSIALLCKISAALGISVADIVNVSSEPSVHLIKPADMPVLWEGSKGGSARLLAGTNGPNMIELWHWEMPPGERFEGAAHATGTYELLHVEKGTLTLKVDKTELIVSKGCSAVAKTDVAHEYLNKDKDKLVFTMSVTELHV